MDHLKQQLNNQGTKLIQVIGLVFFALVLLLPAVTLAAPTFQINYQGKLTDTANTAVADGDYNLRFKLCTDSSCSSVIFDESHIGTDKVTVTNGLFSVMIGSVSTTLDTLNFNQSVYLEVNVGGTGAPTWETLLPRKVIGSVPNSFNTQKFDGLATTSFLRSDITNATATITNLNTTNSTTTSATYLGATAGLNNVYISNWSDLTSVANFWSTSSADYWETTQAARGGGGFSTTSADYWDSTKSRWTSANATTSFNTLITPYSTQAYNSSTFLTLVGWFATSTQYLTTTTAASTYTTQVSSTATYLTIANAALTYQSIGSYLTTESDPIFMAASTSLAYQPIGSYLTAETDPVWLAASTSYLTVADFNATSTNYLTVASATATYLTIANAASTYLTQANAALTYQTIAGDINFSTTSADYWDTTKNRWATSSADYYESTIARWTSANATTSFISLFNGTTTDALAEGGNNLYWTSARATSSFNLLLPGYASFVSSTYSTQAYNSSTFLTLVGWYATSSQYLTTTTAASTYLSLVNWYATTTNGLAEGGNNLYWTSLRATSSFISLMAGTSTSILAEGSNLYWTSARATSSFNTLYGTATAKNPFDQWLDTTNTPTFANLSITNNATTSGYLTVGSAPTGANFTSGNLNVQNSLVVGGNINVAAGSYYKYNNVNLAYASTTRSNYFFGGAGNLTMTGSHNVSLGLSTLAANTEGDQNIAIGNYALTNNTTGYQNIANGTSALRYNTTGSQNVSLGESSLYYASAPTGVTAVGFASGYGLTGANDYNSLVDTYATFIGYQASRDSNIASTTPITNATAIGYNARVGGSNMLVLGGTGAYAVNVGIGTASPNYKLEVNGTASTTNLLVGGNATTSGYLTVGTAPASSNWTAGNLNIQNNGVFGGTVSSTGLQVNGNVIITGNATTTNTTSTRLYTSTFGLNSEYFTDLTDGAALINTAGVLTHSTANGYVHIPASGASAQLLQYTSAGTAKWITLSGQATIADGGALTVSDLTCTDCLGTTEIADSYVLNTSDTMSGSLDVGTTFSAGTSTIKNLIVQNVSTSTFAGGLTVGTSQFVVQQSTGNVGIGKTSPATALDVAGTVSSTGLQVNGNGTMTGQLTVGSNPAITDAGALIAYNSGAVANGYGIYVSTTNSSNVAYGIYSRAAGSTNAKGVYGETTSGGTSGYGVHGAALGAATTNYGIYGTASGATTNYAGYFNGNVYMAGNATTTGNLNVQGWLSLGTTATNTGYKLTLPQNAAKQTGYGIATGWDTYSDSRTKSNQQPIDYGLQEILELTPKRYSLHTSTFKDGQVVYTDEGVSTVGLIAQEVYGIIPEAANRPQDESSQFWSMNYDTLIPVMIKAIQELAAQVDNHDLTGDFGDSANSSSTISATDFNQVKVYNPGDYESYTPSPPVVVNGEAVVMKLSVFGGSEFNGNIMVSGEVIFRGAITVEGEAGFKSKVTFEKAVEFNDHLSVDSDTASTTMVFAGADGIDVVFSQEYQTIPIVSVTPQSRLIGSEYWISNKTVKGFRINVEPVLLDNVKFDWIALAVSGQVAGAAEKAILGCTSENALNYNSSATQDNGSCFFNQPTPIPIPAPAPVPPLVPDLAPEATPTPVLAPEPIIISEPVSASASESSSASTTEPTFASVLDPVANP